MSGGGRCNFTNLNATADNYISHNPHFCKSALKQYTPYDFLALVKKYKIPYVEKQSGQLFCEHKSSDIVQMLAKECESAGVNLKINTHISRIRHESGFHIETQDAKYQSDKLVIATGGLSIPTMGASPFGYKIAEQFGHHIHSTRAGLVPFTLHTKDKERLACLSGVSISTTVKTGDTEFSDELLFTHRGLSGPAILQLSSYWQPGETISINLLPEINLSEWLVKEKQNRCKKSIKNILLPYLPKSLLKTILASKILEQSLQETSNQQIVDISNRINNWQLIPNNTEGYRTAEVTLGGVNCNELSSKTMESQKQAGLYFIGEVVDVTGWLGGYNFQWAWASGYVAGKAIAIG